MTTVPSIESYRDYENAGTILQNGQLESGDLWSGYSGDWTNKTHLSIRESTATMVHHSVPWQEDWSIEIIKFISRNIEPKDLFLSLLNFNLSSTEEFTSPFESLELSISKYSRVLMALLSVNEFTGLPYHQRLSDRLKSLIEEEKAENPDDWEFSLESLADFLSFMGMHQDLKLPDICLTTDGLIEAQWRESANRNIVVEFNGGNKTQFVLFAPRGNETSQLTGVVTIEDLWETIKTYGADRWCKR